ncbi:delta-class carbonic anhydrase [Pseudoalteromonas tunicata]|uniref:delta-class carbonic anhydrase n=1 Tax=Pseudoalteromonas tunicata TaxID=314281 RepID=UPI00273E4EE3|nr:delta-class carbonic anhydrase [Pseudoalteromonas tunicata]MDP5213797.1 delta-class carbonic anhydrase [Pseudoalteromonas tunicata]
MNGFHQVKLIPNNAGISIKFLGATSGPKYSAQQCSPLKACWSVRPPCAKLISILATWYKSNVFKKEHAHGV